MAHRAWSGVYNTSNSWSVLEIISSPDMGNSNVLFSFFYTGNSYNINDWYFDDFEIFKMEPNDLAMTNINMNSQEGAGTKYVRCTIINKGQNPAAEYVMSYQFEGHDAIEETFEDALQSLESKEISFAVPTNIAPGSCNLTVSILTEDDDMSNNTMSKR